MMKPLRYIGLAALAALLGLGSSIGSLSGGALAQAQPECTVTLQPGESIQQVIDQAQEGDVICLAEGTWEENIKIEKSLMLRGEGESAEEVRIVGVEGGHPVIRIESEEEIEVTIENLAAIEAKEDDGIQIGGKAQVSIRELQVSSNGSTGLWVGDSAQVSLTDSTVSGNGLGGLIVVDSARVSLTDDAVSDNGRFGLRVIDSAQVTLTDSAVSGNGEYGLWVGDSVQVSLTDSIVSDNNYCGIWANSEAHIEGSAEMRGNGADLCGFAPASVRKPLVPQTDRTSLSIPSDYRTVQEAVDAIAPGGTITVAPGTYTGGLILWKPLTLRGTGRDQTVLRALAERRLVISIIAEAQEVKLEGMGFTGSQDDGLWIYARTTLQNVHIAENGGDGFWVPLGVPIWVMLIDSVIEGNGQDEDACGIKGTFIFGWGNTFSGNQEDACEGADAQRLSRTLPPDAGTRQSVSVPEEATSVQEAIDLVTNGGTIVVGPGTYEETLEIFNKSITLKGAGRDQVTLTSEERGTQLVIFSDERPVVEVKIKEVTVGPASEDGVAIGGWAQVEMIDTQVSNNGHNGLSVCPWWRANTCKARVTLQYSKVSDNRSDGLHVSGSAQVSLSDSYVSNNRSGGLWVGESVQVSLQNSQVSNNGLYGLQVNDSAQASLQGSQVSDNGSIGLWVVGDSAQVTLIDSTVSDNGDIGLWVWNSAQVTLTSSQVSGHGLVGLLGVGDSAQVTLIDSTVSDNGDIGLWVWNSAQVSLQGSQVSGNDGVGIRMGDSAQATITDSQVSDNDGVGIRMGDSAQATITDSQVSDNGYDGIKMWGSAWAEIRGSTIEGNGTHGDCWSPGPEGFKICNGIEVSDEAQVAVRDSTIRNNTDWGVAAYLKQCGYRRDNFTGQVIFKEMDLDDIAGNNTSGNQDGMGNPGNHPWNRPDVPDGQVCLP
jgi:parallel beta-helix repeat protein